MPIRVRKLQETMETTRKVMAKKAKMRFMLLRCSVWLSGVEEPWRRGSSSGLVISDEK